MNPSEKDVYELELYKNELRRIINQQHQKINNQIDEFKTLINQQFVNFVESIASFGYVPNRSRMSYESPPQSEKLLSSSENDVASFIQSIRCSDTLPAHAFGNAAVQPSNDQVSTFHHQPQSASEQTMTLDFDDAAPLNLSNKSKENQVELPGNLSGTYPAQGQVQSTQQNTESALDLTASQQARASDSVNSTQSTHEPSQNVQQIKESLPSAIASQPRQNSPAEQKLLASSTSVLQNINAPSNVAQTTTNTQQQTLPVEPRIITEILSQPPNTNPNESLERAATQQQQIESLRTNENLNEDVNNLSILKGSLTKRAKLSFAINKRQKPKNIRTPLIDDDNFDANCNDADSDSEKRTPKRKLKERDAAKRVRSSKRDRSRYRSQSPKKTKKE